MSENRKIRGGKVGRPGEPEEGFRDLCENAVKTGETLERVEGAEVTSYTPLKRGVNERPYTPSIDERPHNPFQPIGVNLTADEKPRRGGLFVETPPPAEHSNPGGVTCAGACLHGQATPDGVWSNASWQRFYAQATPGGVSAADFERYVLSLGVSGRPDRVLKPGKIDAHALKLRVNESGKGFLKSTLGKPLPKSFRLVVGVLSFSAALLTVSGCGKVQKSQSAASAELAPVEVRTQAVQTRKSAVFEEVVGTIRAKLHATIEAKASGRILEMPLLLGQKVKAGQLLARLDAPEIRARLEQAEAGLQQAERDWKRMSGLLEQQAATRSDYDAADARYLQAKAAVSEARALLSYVEILAPFDGVITKKWVDVGDLASPGKPLVDLEDPTRLQMEADVPEAIAASIAPDAQMTIRAGGGTGDLSGKVAEIAPIADPTSRTFRVKLDLTNTPGLMSGQFARLLVPLGESTAMHVPVSAVVQRGQLEMVFAVEDQHARLHLVKTGRCAQNETEILSGVDAGDRVVVENASQLVDGQPVNLR